MNKKLLLKNEKEALVGNPEQSVAEEPRKKTAKMKVPTERKKSGGKKYIKWNQKSSVMSNKSYRCGYCDRNVKQNSFRILHATKHILENMDESGECSLKDIPLLLAG